jgi:hypothetical protein
MGAKRHHAADNAGARAMKPILTYLETLAREANKAEAEVIAAALETGLRQPWRERALARYLRGQISRDEAIGVAGIDWVEMAERQRDAMREDTTWALER